MSYFMNLTDLASKHYLARSADWPAANEERGINEGSTGLFHAMRRIFQRMRRDLELREAQKQLAELNGHLLKDIGLSKESIHYLRRENDRIRASQNHKV